MHDANQSDQTNASSLQHEEIITIGKYLQEHRANKKLSIKQISQKTKISTTQLEHLENDRLDNLPNKAYVKGYVKSYAKVLDLEQEKCLNFLTHTYKILFPEQKQQNHIISAENNFPFIPLISVVIICGLVAFLSIHYYNKKYVQTNEHIKKITPQILSANTPLKKEIVIKKKEVPPPVIEETTKKVEVKFEKEIIKPEIVEKVIKPEIKKEEIKKVVKKEKTKQDVVEYKFRPISNTLYNINTTTPETLSYSVKKGTQNLRVMAKEAASWITYSLDNKSPRKRLLKQGETLAISGTTIRMFFGNVNGAKVFLNNKLLDIQSRTGVKSLVFPQSERNKYVLPLFIFKPNGTVVTSEDFLKQKKTKQ